MRWSFESPFDSGLDIDEGIQVIHWLMEDGIDYAHVSQLDCAAMSTKYPGESSFKRIRDGIDRKLPLIAAGGVTSTSTLDRAVALGADFVAIGRAAIGNTHVPLSVGVARRTERRQSLSTPQSEPRVCASAVCEAVAMA